MGIICKSCGKPDKNYAGYCQKCYTYFVVNGFIEYKNQVSYGKMSYVEDIHSKQYSMPICHICGKAFNKLQQHIYYTHKMLKNEYCDRFGIDHKVTMTSNNYHQKMSALAYHYDMDEQLRVAGLNTRFKKGHSSNYKRSPMTMERLKTYGKNEGYKNLRRGLKKYE